MSIETYGSAANFEMFANATTISARGRSRYPSAKSSIRALREGFVPSRPTDNRSFSPPPPLLVRDDRNPREYLPRYVDADDDDEESGSYAQYHNNAVGTNCGSHATGNQNDSDAANGTPQGPSPWDAWLDGTDSNAAAGNADDETEAANDDGSPQGPAPWDCWLDGEESNAVAGDPPSSTEATGDGSETVVQRNPGNGDIGGENQEVGTNAAFTGNEISSGEVTTFDNDIYLAPAPAEDYAYQSTSEGSCLVAASSEGNDNQRHSSKQEWLLNAYSDFQPTAPQPTAPQPTVSQPQAEGLSQPEYAYQTILTQAPWVQEPPYQVVPPGYLPSSIPPSQPKLRASLRHKVVPRFPKTIQPKTHQQGRGRGVNSPVIKGGITKRHSSQRGSPIKGFPETRSGPGQEILWGPLKDTLSVGCPPRREIPPEWLVKPSPAPKKPVPWRQWGAVALLVGLAFLNV